MALHALVDEGLHDDTVALLLHKLAVPDKESLAGLLVSDLHALEDVLHDSSALHGGEVVEDVLSGVLVEVGKEGKERLSSELLHFRVLPLGGELANRELDSLGRLVAHDKKVDLALQVLELLELLCEDGGNKVESVRECRKGDRSVESSGS